MILVFGKTGQVARELQRLGNVVALGREEADLSEPKSCADAIRNYAPHAVINAAAYTSVDMAEKEEALASVINTDAPAAMAKICAELDTPLVHISTDYVFDGKGESSWAPSDPTVPQNAYGRTKLAGERSIRQSGATYAILRTSWVVSAHGTNFIKTMLRLAKTIDEINVVADQIGGPTTAHDIAAACLLSAEQLIKDPSKSGTYHYSGAPEVSWAEFATEIFARAGLSVTVNPVPSAVYPTPAVRPLNSRMDCTAIEQVFGVDRPDWRLGLDKILCELRGGE